MAAVGALLAFSFAIIEPTFVNLFWQIADGSEILRTAHLPTHIASVIESGHLLAHEWLFEIAAAALVSHGLYAVLVGTCAVAAAATPLLIYALARASGCTSWAAGVVAFVSIGTRFVGTAVRPETIAVDLLALELLVLARALPVWSAVPIAILWANLHASATLSIVVPSIVALASLVRAGPHDALARRAISVAVLSAAASLVTPYGFALWAYAWNHGVKPDPSTAVIGTWEALSFASIGAWTAVLPGLLVFALCGISEVRRRLPELAVMGLFFIATIVHQRYAVFLAVGWAVPMARTLDARALFSWLAGLKRPAASLTLVTLVLAAAAFTSNARREPIPIESMGTAAVIAREHRLSGNAYVDIAWASYLIYRGLPLRMLVDGHADGSYPPSVWSDTVALQRPTVKWSEVLDRRGISVVIVASSSPLAQAIANRRQWQRVDERDGVVAYVRRPGVRRSETGTHRPLDARVKRET